MAEMKNYPIPQRDTFSFFLNEYIFFALSQNQFLSGIN